MVKKVLTILIVFGFVWAGEQEAHSQIACGGMVEYNADCSNADRAWHFICCPEGYRVQGVAYNDLSDRDEVDAISVVCQSKANNMMTPLSEKASIQWNKFVCSKKELMVGVRAADIGDQRKKYNDALDGLTALCLNQGTQAVHFLPNKDLDGQRATQEISIMPPNRVKGIAYKEYGDKKSDKVDCVTIIK